MLDYNTYNISKKAIILWLYMKKKQSNFMSTWPSSFNWAKLAKLARWPGHLSSSEDMDVKVEHFLTSLSSVVDDNTVALSHTLFSCNLASN